VRELAQAVRTEWIRCRVCGESVPLDGCWVQELDHGVASSSGPSRNIEPVPANVAGRGSNGAEMDAAPHSGAVRTPEPEGVGNSAPTHAAIP
jgi:hypothetical protein